MFFVPFAAHVLLGNGMIRAPLPSVALVSWLGSRKLHSEEHFANTLLLTSMQMSTAVSMEPLGLNPTAPLGSHRIDRGNFMVSFGIYKT